MYIHKYTYYLNKSARIVYKVAKNSFHSFNDTHNRWSSFARLLIVSSYSIWTGQKLSIFTVYDKVDLIPSKMFILKPILDTGVSKKISNQILLLWGLYGDGLWVLSF